jgi:hypothetical protein
MTKLEELKANAARASDWASWATAWAARADAAYMAARAAYQAEPEKTQEDNSND